jgi:hypothetical protein
MAAAANRWFKPQDQTGFAARKSRADPQGGKSGWGNRQSRTETSEGRGQVEDRQAQQCPTVAAAKSGRVRLN